MMLAYSAVKKITVDKARKILKELSNNNKSLEDRAFSVLSIYSGKSKEQLIFEGKRKCLDLFSLIEKQIEPGNIKPVNNRYINSGATLIEFDFTLSKLNEKDTTDLIELALADNLENLEKIVSLFAVRYRKESYKPVWETANRDEVQKLLNGASWRQAIESLHYVKTLALSFLPVLN